MAWMGIANMDKPVFEHAPTITAARSLEMAAAAWAPGVKMRIIIDEGWSRGFLKEQTLHECIQAGYSACIADPAITQRWHGLDEAVAENEQRARERDERAQRYEAYWERNPHRLHHEIDCPNPACDRRLKLNRPPKGSGEMWDSLAECPYCEGTFFYESRPLRIDVAFKGFIGRS